MPLRDPSTIASWHAHGYFDAASRSAAWALRERIRGALAEQTTLGGFMSSRWART